MCGSCAMTVNGRPRWTCRTHVSKVATDGSLTIGPLRQPAGHQGPRGRHAAVLREVAAGAGPLSRRRRPAPTRSNRSRRTRPQRRAADAGIECINCGVCYAACDTVRWNPDYLGPAALNRAWTLVNDVRDADQYRAAHGGRRGWRLSRLPFASVVPGALSAGAQSDRVDRRTEAADRAGLSAGRDQAMNVRLYLWQRVTAALMVPLLLVHLAVIFYASRKGCPPPRSWHARAAAWRGRCSTASSSGGLACMPPIGSAHGAAPNGLPLPRPRARPCGDPGLRAAARVLGFRAVVAVVLP